MIAGFYKKQEETLLYAPNIVEGDGYVLIIQEADQYEYPIDGWHWFETKEEAFEKLQIILPTQEVIIEELIE